jgi:outer membrane protein assembly factor BamE (lipoprotein component of BamABCDE complex)
MIHDTRLTVNMTGALVLACALLAGTALNGCAPQVSQRGHVMHDSVVEQLEPGRQSQNQVANMLGSPTSIAAFDDKTWYYISSNVERIAFLDPDVKDRSILELRFNTEGVLDEIRHYTLEDGQEVEMVARSTPTPGREMTILEQFFGNLGRFNEATGAGGTPGSPGGSGIPGQP